MMNGQRNRAGALVAVALVLGLALVLRARPLLAALYANLGATHQTQTELTLYDDDHADDPTLDEVRRQVDLSITEARYNQALEVDPGQAQARIQLAQIALSRGQYAQALEHAQAAGQAGHDDWRARLTLGDALVVEGHVVEGVELVRGLPRAEARFECWAWYRHWLRGETLRDEYRRAAYAWHAVVLLNPDDENSAGAMKIAEQKAKEN